MLQDARTLGQLVDVGQQLCYPRACHTGAVQAAHTVHTEHLLLQGSPGDALCSMRRCSQSQN
jgi:hypothetical protein